VNETKTIEAIKKGNLRAEEELLNFFDERIRFIVLSRLNQYIEEIDDVVQDIKMAVIISLRKGNFSNNKDGVTLGGYVYGITMNKISDYLKKLYKEKQIKADIADNEVHPLTDTEFIEKDEIKEHLKKAITNLKHKYKEIIYLRYYEELSIQEISNQLNLPARRVSERINYAIKLLKKEVDNSAFQMLTQLFI
jgi:RNA polymerase sigma-70 factor (ECF subfamily)